MTNERPEGAVGNVMFDLGRNLRVNVWVTGDVETDAARLGDTYAAIREWLAHDEKARGAIFPPEPERPQTPQDRPQGRPAPRGGGGGQRGGQRRPQQGGRGETRVTKYQQIDGECDICGGPVGRYPRTGNMRSDKAVCLGTCKDGDYIHTAFWLDDDNGDDGEYGGGPDPDELPF